MGTPVILEEALNGAPSKDQNPMAPRAARVAAAAGRRLASSGEAADLLGLPAR